ncbi:MAG: HlyD family efflux transporter periplasmic adaptor subunit [Bacteroidota bacterium]
MTADRSEEMQDIISRTPGGVVRYGTFALLLVFTILFIIAWFVRYPDVVEADVMLTTTPSPVTIVSRLPGRLHLILKENDKVSEGDLIGYIRSNASADDVQELDRVVDQMLTGDVDAEGINSLSVSYKPGDIQPALASFITRQNEYTVFVRNKIEERQEAQLQKQAVIYNKLLDNQAGKLELMNRELMLGKEKFISDSILYTKQVISKNDYNASSSIYLQQRRVFRSAEAEVIATQLQLTVLSKQIEETEASRQTKKNQLETAVVEALKELQAQVKKWKDNYLFISPMNGTVAYLQPLENSQAIESGKNLFSIVPDGKNVVARAELPLAGAGKVKVGQRVNMKLDSYPYEQFGMLTGTVSSISLLPNNDRYLVTLDLPQGMSTTYHTDLPFRQQLKGRIEIITEDLNVLERIFYQFRKLLMTR